MPGQSWKKPQRLSSLTSPSSFQMNKLRPREVKRLAQSHTAKSNQSWVSWLPVHCLSIIPHMASFYPISNHSSIKMNGLSFLPTGRETEILCFLNIIVCCNLGKCSYDCRLLLYLIVIATAFSMCFSALSSSFPQRSLALIPRLLAVCLGQVVQRDVCSMTLCVEPSVFCHEITVVWKWDHLIWDVTEVITSFLQVEVCIRS